MNDLRREILKLFDPASSYSPFHAGCALASYYLPASRAWNSPDRRKMNGFTLALTREMQRMHIEGLLKIRQQPDYYCLTKKGTKEALPFRALMKAENFIRELKRLAEEIE